MKYIKIIVVFCAILVLQPHVLKAQDAPQIDINAIVVGSNNEPIEGAVVKNSNNFVATTDAKGAFTIQALQNSILKVTAAGFNEKEIIATADLAMIILEPSIEEVQLLFRKAEKKDLVGGVSVVNMPELYAKNFTTYSLDGLNTLVNGYNGNSIWGRGQLLVVVDGVEREAGNIKPSEIEQITVLKGAGAVALYGTRAVNGVIYITTKRGIVAKQQIDVRVNSGMYVPKRYPNYLGAADYMTYFNEARINDGLDTTFSRQTISNTASGLNPYRYPDIDFYSSDFLKKAYNRSDVNAEIYGGNKSARYYTNIGFSRTGSLLNFGEGKKSFNTNFNIRGNVDMNISSWLKASIDAVAILGSARNPQINYWEQAANLRPTMGSTPYHPLVPISMIDLSNPENQALVENSIKVDDKYILGGNLQNQTNPFAEIYLGGYDKNVNRQFMFNTGLDMDLGNIVKGLAFRTKVAVDYRTSYNEGYDHTYRTYEIFQWVNAGGTDIIDSLVPSQIVDRVSEQLYIRNSSFRQILLMTGQLDYTRTFNNNHNVFAMLVANAYQNSASGQYQKANNTNLGTHLGYNFKHKYYMEFNGSYMYTTKLPSKNRLNFSPVASVGWCISNESFMKAVTAIDHFKITSTVGRLYTDIEIASNYLYSARYLYRGVGFYQWSGVASGRDVTTSLRGGNSELKAPYRDEINFGIEASFFKKFLEIEGNYFSTKYMNGTISGSNTDLFPGYMELNSNRSFVSYINFKESMRTGYDFNIRLNKKVSKIDWTLGVVGTYYDTENLNDSLTRKYAYQNRKGKPIDGIWGLKANGFYADQDDIDNSPHSTFGTVKPGDIKYIDQNGDNVIDLDDEVLLAKGGWYGAPFTLGINLTAKWENLTFYAQCVGQWGGYGIKNRLTDWVYGQRKYSDVVVNRWANYTNPFTGEVVDTRATATYPRLTSQESQNNFRNSDFWLYKTNRFDLSKVQISYSLPLSVIRNTFIDKVDIYISGFNLLTFSAEKEYLETNVGSAPQTRFYNIGISASF